MRMSYAREALCSMLELLTMTRITPRDRGKARQQRDGCILTNRSIPPRERQRKERQEAASLASGVDELDPRSNGQGDSRGTLVSISSRRSSYGKVPTSFGDEVICQLEESVDVNRFDSSAPRRLSAVGTILWPCPPRRPHTALLVATSITRHAWNDGTDATIALASLAFQSAAMVVEADRGAVWSWCCVCLGRLRRGHLLPTGLFKTVRGDHSSTHDPESVPSRRRQFTLGSILDNQRRCVGQSCTHHDSNHDKDTKQRHACNFTSETPCQAICLRCKSSTFRSPSSCRRRRVVSQHCHRRHPDKSSSVCALAKGGRVLFLVGTLGASTGTRLSRRLRGFGCILCRSSVSYSHVQHFLPRFPYQVLLQCRLDKSSGVDTDCNLFGEKTRHCGRCFWFMAMLFAALCEVGASNRHDTVPLMEANFK
ncbi:hypothetical protein Ae201684_018843 [Aphanomyces euteiches]|uniref:Uncharacterized protein n=1 Tax=Aphanomyces euteiches TaxID=100861 RepID=A0A6G0W5V9_9STRA|nr:hypothetical protein Ae201684_018843 [Aphanomyces euteiches]